MPSLTVKVIIFKETLDFIKTSFCVREFKQILKLPIEYNMVNLYKIHK